MTTTLLVLPAPLCAVCGDGAYRDDDTVRPGYEAHGTLAGDGDFVCVECAAFAVRDGIQEAEDFAWWTPEAAARFKAQIEHVRELCPCGEVRDDFGACWRCDAIQLVPLEGSREARQRTDNAEATS